MTLQIFLVLLTVCATITALVTETVKKTLDSLKVKYASNIIALIVAIIVGAVIVALYYVSNTIEFTGVNIAYMFLMALANWIGSMVGYDKVKQAITQLSTRKEE